MKILIVLLGLFFFVSCEVQDSIKMSDDSFDTSATEKLFAAIKVNSVDGVEAALRDHADPDAFQGDYSPLILCLERRCRSEIVDTLIYYGASVDLQNSRGNNPLMVAVIFNDLENFLKLIYSPRIPNVDLVNNNGDSLVFLVVKYTTDEYFLKELWRLQADFWVEDAEGKNPCEIEPLGTPRRFYLRDRIPFCG